MLQVENIKIIIKKCMMVNKLKKYWVFFIAFLCVFLVLYNKADDRLFGGEELYMLCPMTNSQMMSFVIKTNNNKIVIIDGGSAGDAEHLFACISKINKENITNNKVICNVCAWFLTHLHYDHTGALAEILSNQDKYNINIDNIYYQFPPESWVHTNEPEYFDDIITINSAMRKSKSNKSKIHSFKTIKIDNVCFMPINDIDLTITNNAVNNTSIVYKVTMSNSKTILFLGDAGYEMGNKILNEVDYQIIKSDICQMAHHGQHGVSEKFYNVVSPKVCLWPTPEWLWENDVGLGKGSGPWTIDCEKLWMKSLNVKKHYRPIKEDIILK